MNFLTVPQEIFPRGDRYLTPKRVVKMYALGWKTTPRFPRARDHAMPQANHEPPQEFRQSHNCWPAPMVERGFAGVSERAAGAHDPTTTTARPQAKTKCGSSQPLEPHRQVKFTQPLPPQRPAISAAVQPGFDAPLDNASKLDRLRIARTRKCAAINRVCQSQSRSARPFSEEAATPGYPERFHDWEPPGSFSPLPLNLALALAERQPGTACRRTGFRDHWQRDIHARSDSNVLAFPQFQQQENRGGAVRKLWTF